MLYQKLSLTELKFLTRLEKEKLKKIHIRGHITIKLNSHAYIVYITGIIFYVFKSFTAFVTKILSNVKNVKGYIFH